MLIIGFYTDLLCLSLQEMLFRRTCLLVAYEDSNKDLSKAKPQKREAVSRKYFH